MGSCECKDGVELHTWWIAEVARIGEWCHSESLFLIHYDCWRDTAECRSQSGWWCLDCVHTNKNLMYGSVEAPAHTIANCMVARVCYAP